MADLRKIMKIAILDSNHSDRQTYGIYLKKRGFESVFGDADQETLESLKKESPEYLLFKVRYFNDSELTYLKHINQALSATKVIVLSESRDYELAKKTLSHGAHDVLMPLFKSEDIIFSIEKAESRGGKSLTHQLAKNESPKNSHSFFGIVSDSNEMKKIFSTIEKIAVYKTTCLITGESGTGKELVAKAIHVNSEREKGPFITINCGAIPETLLESELFGHAKGSFTGANVDKKGLFEEASGGTLFLDEIGELPLLLQVKLLRVLQEQEIRRVGDVSARKIDVRIVTATHRDLIKEMEQGRFREDLFYRLNVMPIHLPALRERREDIPLLVEYFMTLMAAKLAEAPTSVSKEALKILIDYHWPGNIRELQNTIERASLLAGQEKIESKHLPQHLLEVEKPLKANHIQLKLEKDEMSIKKVSRYIEEELIKRALQHCDGNRTQAAKHLEISHRALLYKIKEYELSEY